MDLSFEWGHGDSPRGTLKLLREGKLIEDPVLEDFEPTKKTEHEKKSGRWVMALGGVLIGSLGFVLGRVQRRT